MSKHTLGEICDRVGGIIRTGPFGTQLHESDYTSKGIPVVMPKNIVEGKISTGDVAYIDEATTERLAQHKLKAGDIVYGRRGDIGRRALITRQQAGWLCGTGCLRISLGESVLDPAFLFYYLGQPAVTAWIANQAIGATLPNLNTTIIRSVAIRYPALPVQHKVASILGSYDDLIQNNSCRIKILEEMARLIYEEWFVKFRFPRHEKVKVVKSELGPIPEGWDIVPFTDIADVLSGGTPKTTIPEYWGGHIPFFTPKDASDFTYIVDTEKNITEIGLDNCNSVLYAPDTVFITARGTVGKVALPAVPMAMNQSCYALVGRDGIPQLHVFLMLKQGVEYLKSNTGGATFDTIIVDTFRRMKVIKVPLNIVQAADDLICPILHQVRNLTVRIRNLKRTRDLLLPRLISGEMDVEKLDIKVPAENSAAVAATV